MPRKPIEDPRWFKPGPQKFTDAYLRWLQAGGAPKEKEGKEFLVFEAGESGLAIRVPLNKRLRFLFQRRQEDGKAFHCSLGRYPGVSLATAQKRAEVLAGEQSSGANLRMTRPTRRSRRAARIGIPTLAETVKAWKLGNPDLRPSYVSSVEKGMFRVFKDLLPRQIDAVTGKELEDRWELLPGAPARSVARRWAHSVFNWAVQKYQDYGVTNPLAGRLRPKSPAPRKQHLGGEAMRTVYVGAGKLERKERAGLIRFSMLSLLRRSEAATLRWSDFNSSLTELRIPAERMKGGRNDHFVPIVPAARALLQTLPRHEGCDLVFTLDGKTPLVGFSYTKNALDDALTGEGLPKFTIHDFRRSAATLLARFGIDHAVIDLLLAHVPFKGVKGVYNVYAYEAERRAALERWADFLAGGASASIILPAPPKVLPASPSTPIPAPLNGEDYEALRRELEIADLRTALIAQIMGHPDMDGPKGFRAMVQHRKRLLPKHAYRDVETIVTAMAWILADMMLYGIERVCRPEIERLRDLWAARRDRKRGIADRCHMDARQARERAQADLASSIDREAREAEKAADLAEDWIERAERVLDCLDDETPQHPSDIATTLARLLANFTSDLFTAPAPHLARKMVKMATERTVTPGQMRMTTETRRWPKDLMLEPPTD
jgi:integrase